MHDDIRSNHKLRAKLIITQPTLNEHVNGYPTPVLGDEKIRSFAYEKNKTSTSEQVISGMLYAFRHIEYCSWLATCDIQAVSNEALILIF